MLKKQKAHNERNIVFLLFIRYTKNNTDKLKVLSLKGSKI